METVSINGNSHRINHRDIRFTAIKDNREAAKISLDCYIRLGGHKRLNFKAAIPYSAIADEFRNCEDNAYITGHPKAEAIVDNVILNLPVGVPGEKLTFFEKAMFRALASTIVQANADVKLIDINSLNPSTKFIIRNAMNGITDTLLEDVPDAGELDTELRYGLDDIISIEDGVIVHADEGAAYAFYEITDKPQTATGDTTDNTLTGTIRLNDSLLALLEDHDLKLDLTTSFADGKQAHFRKDYNGGYYAELENAGGMIVAHSLGEDASDAFKKYVFSHDGKTYVLSIMGN